MRALALALAISAVAGDASAWAGSGLGPYVPPPPHDYSRRELRTQAVLADSLAPWCAFMAFGLDAPGEARLRIEPGAVLPEGLSIDVAGEADPAALDRFLACFRPLLSTLPGTYVGTRALTRTYPLHRDTPSASIRSSAGAFVAAHDAEIRACAPGGAAIAAIALDVYRGEVRLDSVYVPTIDPRYAMASTGDSSVHDCVSAIVLGGHLDTRARRVFPVVELTDPSAP